MKGRKKLLGYILAAVFVISLVFNKPMVSQAGSTYTVSISVGDVENASFDTSALKINSKDAKISEKTRTTDSGAVPFKLDISNLAYGDTVEFDAAKLIKLDLAKDSKYVVKGLRVSGADSMVNEDGNTNIKITVNNSEVYVAAYKICSIIPYKVQYVDESGKALYNEEVLYGAEGEDTIVPARHFNGYKPNKVEESVKLAKDTVVKFVYKKLESTVEYETVTQTSTLYVNGQPTYVYEYEYLEGTPTVNTVTRPGNETVTTRRVTNNREDGQVTTIEGEATEDNNGAAEGANAEGNFEAEASEGTDVATIDDEQTPTTGGEAETIEEEPTPTTGDAKENLSRALVITFIILAIVIVAFTVTMYMMNKNKQKTFAIPKNNDEEK